MLTSLDNSRNGKKKDLRNEQKIMKTTYVYVEEYGWINVSLFICTLKAKLKKIENKMIIPLTQPKITVDDHRRYVKKRSGIIIHSF